MSGSEVTADHQGITAVYRRFKGPLYKIKLTIGLLALINRPVNQNRTMHRSTAFFAAAIVSVVAFRAKGGRSCQSGWWCEYADGLKQWWQVGLEC